MASGQTCTLQHLRAAVQALYGAPDEAHRQAADAFLKGARAEGGFWLLALPLLTAPQSSAQERFFAAHSLRIVAQKSRELVEPAAGQQLAVELGRLVVAAAAEQQHWAVANQLAGALAELAVRAPWWDPGRLVADVLQLLGPAPLSSQDPHQPQPEEPGRLNAALLVLASLPEACLSKDVSLHPQRRADVAAALAVCPTIPALLNAALGQPALPGGQLATLQLLQAWSLLPGSAAALQHLDPGVLGQLHQAALDPVAPAAEAAEAIAALYTACSQPQHPTAVSLLAQLLQCLQGAVGGGLQQAAAQHAQQAGQLLNNATTILSSAGPALLAQLGAGPAAPAADALPDQQQGTQPGQLWAALRFVAGCLLELLQHPDAEVALGSLPPLDDSLIPGLAQLVQQGGHDVAQQAQQLLEALCSALLRRMQLPAGISSAFATADARDLPDSVRLVRRELSDSFRAAAGALGTEQAAGHLLDLASHYCSAWRASQDPGQGWQQTECALYAANLVLPRHLAQLAQQGPPAAQQAQRAAEQALRVCLACLSPSAPKLVGTALTLLGGLAEALSALLQQQLGPTLDSQAGAIAEQHSYASSRPASAAAQSQLGGFKALPDLLAVLLGLLGSQDAKLSRNAATAVHRFCSSPHLAAHLASQHPAWVGQLAELYCSGGGLQQRPKGGEDLSREEFLLRSLCCLARASASTQAAAGTGQPPGSTLQGLVLQLAQRAAGHAAAAMGELEQQLAAAGGSAGLAQQDGAVAAAAARCGAQLEVAALIVKEGGAGAAPEDLQQVFLEVCGVSERALQLVLQQAAAQARHGRQADLAALALPLLRGLCAAVAAAVSAAPTPAVLQSALSALAPQLSQPLHPCVLEALTTVVGAAAVAAGGLGAATAATAGGAAAATAGAAAAPAGRPPNGSASSMAPAMEGVLPGLCQAVAACLAGCSGLGADPEWAVPPLEVGTATVRQLPQLLAPGVPGSGALRAELLGIAQRGAASYHRDVCEATLELAAALLCVFGSNSGAAAEAAGASQQPDGGLPGGADEDSKGGACVVLWLLLAASGAMPPYMVLDIAQALHSVWDAVGTPRFSSWVAQAVVDLAPEDAPWRGWKAGALQAALGDLLSPQSLATGARFKKQLKVLCGGKKKGKHVALPARRL